MVTRFRAPHKGEHVLPDMAVGASIRVGSQVLWDHDPKNQSANRLQ